MNVQNKKKIFLILKLLAISIILSVFMKSCVFPWIKHFENAVTDKDKQAKTRLAHEQYLKLFTVDAQNKLSLWDNKISINKHSFSSFDYDKKYEILIHKINLESNKALDSLIFLEKKSVEVPPDIVYEGYDINSFSFRFSSNHDSIVQQIYITHDEKLLNKVVIGDSIVDYNLSVTNLSVRYGLNDVKDFLLINNQANIYEKTPKKININLVLYKKGLNLFFIFIYPINKSLLVDSYFLPNLLGFSSNK